MNTKTLCPKCLEEKEVVQMECKISLENVLNDQRPMIFIYQCPKCKNIEKIVV
jgi:hypothetical protein